MKQLLYATSNPGKQKEVGKLLAHYGINILTPQDFDLSLEPEEDGKSLEENAIHKCREYIETVDDPNIIFMADDTGVEIDALGGEPGIHVRRWKGYRMTDEEIIEYCIERMKNIPKGKRGAQFRTVLAIGAKHTPIETVDGILRGEIVEKPIALRMKGFPFESLLFIPEYGVMLGDIHQMTSKEKEKREFLSHRERAVLKALPRLKRLLREDEVYDVVDEKGKKISSATWTEVHTKGLLHPSISLLLFKTQKREELLMQQRSDTMAQRPGAWQHSAGGHIKKGQSVEEGLMEEIQEELFASGDIPSQLKPQFVLRFIQKEDIPNNNELLHLFEAFYDGEFSPDAKEVGELEWKDWKFVKADIEEHPKKYTNSFIQIVKKYVGHQGRR